MTKSLGQFAKLVDVGLISNFCGSKLLIRAGSRRCPRKIRYAFVVSSPLRVLRIAGNEHTGRRVLQRHQHAARSIIESCLHGILRNWGQEGQKEVYHNKR